MNGKAVLDLVEEFEVYNRARNLSPYTVEWYTRHVRDFVVWLGGEDPLAVEARRIRQYLSEKMERGFRPATVRGYFASLSTFYAFLVRDGAIEEYANPMNKALRPRVPEVLIEPLSLEEIQRLLNSFNPPRGGIPGIGGRKTYHRDYVICLLMLDTGLRVSEVAKLSIEDVDFERKRLKVIGKGNKPRWAYFGSTVSEALRNYLVRCRPKLGNGTGALFPSVATGDYIAPKEISVIMTRRMDRAGIPRTVSSAHRLRHTMAIMYLRNGGDVFTLQRLLGHASLEMTRRYVSLVDGDLAAGHRKAGPIDHLDL